MKLTKKLFTTMVASVVSLSLFAGCSSAPATTENETNKEEIDKQDTNKGDSNVAKTGVTLEFMTNIVGAQAELLKELSEEFTQETGIGVEFIAPGASYEEVMKTKMAANDLPDLFTTHGWSVARYSEYLKPLNDEVWATNLNPAIDSRIKDKEGNIYVLPMDVDLAGIVYNPAILEEADVNVDDLTTWETFTEALQKVKDAGYTPIHIGGKDNWTIGQYYDWVAPSFYITHSEHDYSEELKDGTFDWTKWNDINQMLSEWVAADYLNKDVLTADYISGIKGLAEGKVAFEFYGNGAIVEAKGFNPNIELGMMPIPAKYEGDSPTLIGGERTAVGVWKDSKYADESLQFLNFLARPENLARVASSNALPAGLKGVEADQGDLTQYYEKYKDIPTVAYFDREYLPSGMWDDFCITGANVIMKGEKAIEDAAKHMEQSYKDKRAQ